MNIDDDTKRFIIRRLKWVGLYLGITLILVWVLPAPYDLISVCCIFVLANFLMRNVMKKYGGTGGIRDLFGYIFSSTSENDRSRLLKYHCINCGREHRKIACPNCGFKMKKVG
jgi:hypothetical protein